VGQITWNHALQSWYSNLLILVELAHVQCVSTTTCERAFSVQNLIKTKVRNRLGSKNLEAMLQIALEGQMRGYITLSVTMSHFGRMTSNTVFCMLIPLLI
jgi:hypothetical protein